ncbi:MAG: hypothetical protein ACLRRN_08275 [Oscillospiraceae bacterium]
MAAAAARHTVQLHDVSVAQAVQMARKAIDDNLENYKGVSCYESDFEC